MLAKKRTPRFEVTVVASGGDWVWAAAAPSGSSGPAATAGAAIATRNAVATMQLFDRFTLSAVMVSSEKRTDFVHHCRQGLIRLRGVFGSSSRQSRPRTRRDDNGRRGRVRTEDPFSRCAHQTNASVTSRVLLGSL